MSEESVRNEMFLILHFNGILHKLASRTVVGTCECSPAKDKLHLHTTMKRQSMVKSNEALSIMLTLAVDISFCETLDCRL